MKGEKCHHERKTTPTESAVRVLGGKWITTILLTLLQGPCRYRDLRQGIPNLSDKVLTERLKALQAAGIVAHEKGTGNTYFLTARGESLRDVLTELYT
jgi:DNA-binding HxlR family transcriptional regulator